MKPILMTWVQQPGGDSGALQLILRRRAGRRAGGWVGRSTGRGTDELGDGVALHQFAHVHPYQRLPPAKALLRQHLRPRCGRPLQRHPPPWAPCCSDHDIPLRLTLFRPSGHPHGTVSCSSCGRFAPGRGQAVVQAADEGFARQAASSRSAPYRCARPTRGGGGGATRGRQDGGRTVASKVLPVPEGPHSSSDASGRREACSPAAERWTADAAAATASGCPTTRACALPTATSATKELCIHSTHSHYALPRHM